MVMVSKFSNFPDKLTENDKLREFELSRSDCTVNKGDLPIPATMKREFMRWRAIEEVARPTSFAKAIRNCQSNKYLPCL